MKQPNPLGIRLSPEEKEILSEIAKKQGKTRHALLKGLILAGIRQAVAG